MKNKYPEPTIISGWVVTDVDYDDDNIFETEEEARDSVDVRTDTIIVWECYVCGERHEDLEDAENCCK